ncbi:MAG TPA: rod shape-determining protein MreC [Candidatus Sulfotelmatobacter sp.]|nr:rod shape-determining protein MreC [Candidatus Sulfotelmatobacter sp.]
MESVLGRYRNLIILVGVLFLQVLGLATQVKRGGGNDPESTRLIRVWAVGAITPFERTLVWAQNGTGNLWHNYCYLRGVRAENRQLKDQIEQMRLKQVRLSEDAAQARRLQTLVAFKEQFISRTVAAQVIGSSGSDLSRTVYIDKGENDGVKRDMAVMTADGIVGKILVAYASVSQVLLISDQSSGVGALLEKTRLQGVLRGTATGEVVLERVMSDEQVPVGETVLTSGGDQIFPKGLPVGTVTKVAKGKDLFLDIKVRPAANLSKLEEVLVLVEKQERQATAEDNVRIRAADILAQRLPSVPDKPATDANPAASATAGGTGGGPAGATGGVTQGSTNPAVAKPAAKPTGGATTTTPAAKNPSGTSNDPGVPAAGLSAKPAGATSTVKKSAPAVPSTVPVPKPETSPSTPAGAPPKQAEPTAPPDSSPPPAAESSPQ